MKIAAYLYAKKNATAKSESASRMDASDEGSQLVTNNAVESPSEHVAGSKFLFVQTLAVQQVGDISTSTLRHFNSTSR